MNPVATGRMKFSCKGGYSKTSFKNMRVPPSVVTALVLALNYSVAANTWKTYGSVEKHILTMEKLYKTKDRVQ